VIVVLVSGGVPVIVVAVCAVASMYGVMVYDVGAPPVDGADHVTVAEFVPAVALRFVTWPGAAGAVGWKRTSTQELLALYELVGNALELVSRYRPFPLVLLATELNGPLLTEFASCWEVDE
jgi:hypothetical protein